jgi:tRNA (guanine37-N1)-methyltransferase
MKIDILTLFPEMFAGLNSSILKRAVAGGIVNISVHDFREFSRKKNRRVDDYSYGGGAGMILEIQPIVDCMRQIENYQTARKIITTPHGKTYDQKKAQELAGLSHLIIICGHYEGIDHRIMDYVDEEISIGDYILTGGEIASMAIVDSVVRLLPNALGNEESVATESFEDYLLEYPQYTRPEEFEGKRVPEVLISGNHEKVRQYRRFKSLELTYHKRPDLLDKAALTLEDKKFLEMIKKGEILSNDF